MKKLLAPSLLGLALLGAAALAGCMDPNPAIQDPNLPHQVNISDTWLQSYIYAQVPKPERVGAGQLKVAVQLYNRTGDDISIDYSYFFTDKAGTKVEDPIATGREFERIPAHGYVTVSFTSLSAAAEDFRLYISRAR